LDPCFHRNDRLLYFLIKEALASQFDSRTANLTVIDKVKTLSPKHITSVALSVSYCEEISQELKTFLISVSKYSVNIYQYPSEKGINFT